MKYLLIFACLFSSFINGMDRADRKADEKKMPLEISTFKRSTRWIDIDTDERVREYWDEKMPSRIENLRNLNTNDNSDPKHGATSPLFDVSNNDELVSFANNLMIGGADPNFACSTGHTPFERAIRKNALRIAWNMASAGGSDSLGLRVLMDHACLTDNENLFHAQNKLFEFLIEKMRTKKISVDGPDALGQTALMNIMQIKRNRERQIIVPIAFRKVFVAALLAHGADLDKKDVHDVSARDRAQKNNLHELLTHHKP